MCVIVHTFPSLLVPLQSGSECVPLFVPFFVAVNDAINIVNTAIDIVNAINVIHTVINFISRHVFGEPHVFSYALSLPTGKLT